MREVTIDNAKVLWIVPELKMCGMCRYEREPADHDVCTDRKCAVGEFIYLDPSQAEEYVLKSVTSKLSTD